MRAFTLILVSCAAFSTNVRAQSPAQIDEIFVKVKDSQITLNYKCKKQKNDELIASREYRVIGSGEVVLSVGEDKSYRSIIHPSQYAQIVNAMLSSGFLIVPNKIPEYSAHEYSGMLSIAELNSRIEQACYFSLQLVAGEYRKEVSFTNFYRGFNEPIKMITNVFKDVH